MKNLFFLIIGFLFFPCVQAQEVSASADKEAILIGEQLKLSLKGVFKNNNNYNWFEIDSIPGFEILKRSPVDTQTNNGEMILNQVLTLTSWDSGKLTIPSFRLGRSRTGSIAIAVSFSKMDPNQPYHDIKNIIPVERPKSSKWYWYLIFGAILVILFLLFFPSSKTDLIKKEAIKEDPFDDAVKRLVQLEQNKSLDPKSYYTELVDIFRQYLHRRKNIRSFSKTTDDLAVQIRSLQLPAGEYNELVQSLRLSDMVKYAKYLPQAVENESALQTIRKNIDIIEKQGNAV
jgi:hypothetical protein